jgi:hypothetical protein
MADLGLNSWEVLFRRALVLIDSVQRAGVTLEEWSFGGGTVLMRRHGHRLSKDVDIFIGDPQYLPLLTPRLNDVAESLTDDYVEQANFLKLVFPEGEIDFVVSGTLTISPVRPEIVCERVVPVETSTEIVAKKLWHRGERFTARDIFDLALVAELESGALHEIAPIMRARRAAILGRIAAAKDMLEEGFQALSILSYRRTFAECVEIVTDALNRARE